MSAIYDRILSQFTDYRSITTFWDDYSIADQFGEEGIKDTFKRSFEHWKHDYKYLTELVMVLNHKMWQWYEQGQTNQRAQRFSELYQTLWEQAREYAETHLKGDELRYYFEVTD